MAKVFMLTEVELDKLQADVEAVKLRKVEHLDTHDPEKQKAQEMFRSFNFAVCNWINEIKR